MTNLADMQRMIVEATTRDWVVVAEEIGCPGLVGQVMRLERQGATGPVAPRTWCITPSVLLASDERFGGLFSKIKPQVMRLNATQICCTGGILLVPKESIE